MKTTLVSVVAILSVFVGAAAFAQSSEDQAIRQAIACREINDDLERLRCLDAATESLSAMRTAREEAVTEQKQNDRENFGLASVGQAKTDDSKNNDSTAKLSAVEIEEDFGAEAIPDVVLEKEEKRLKSITAKVTKIDFNPYGQVTLTLENGQIWRQVDSDGKKLRLRGKNRTYTASVKRGAVGSYRLTIKELKRSISVRRIR